MNDNPSFRKQRDVLRFFAAILVPWLLFGVALVPSMMCLALYRAGVDVELLVWPAAIWYYLVVIAAMFIAISLLLIGVWRLIWYRAYRWSIYGWVWLVIMWLNPGMLGLATGH
jgi:hypothetical protein